MDDRSECVDIMLSEEYDDVHDEIVNDTKAKNSVCFGVDFETFIDEDSNEDISVFENDYNSKVREFHEAFVSEVVEFQKKIEERKEKYYKKPEVKEKIMSVGKYFELERGYFCGKFIRF